MPPAHSSLFLSPTTPRVVASNATISQVNFGWEICSTGGIAETFNVTDYSLTATPK
jgi:hypothetical protein